MLLNLHVKNMALIRELDIDFGEGLNILTGETGAGKSIMIGSINVALGLQSFKGFVCDEETSALVELVFSAEKEELKKKLEEFDVPIEEGQIILSRRLVNGRAISKVNGETVPLSKMKALAALLIDIHGQHEHQSLLYKKNHLGILDEFAKEELVPYKEKGLMLYARYTALKKKIQESSLDEAERRKELDFLTFEMEEIDQANLRPGEDTDLEDQYRHMSNARKIAGNAGECYELMSNGATCAADLISAAVQKLMMVSDIDEEISSLSRQLAEIEGLVTDFNHDCASYLDSLFFNDREFTEIEERLNSINRLKTKYGNSIEKILAYRDEKEARYSELMDYDAFMEKLRKDFDSQEELLRKNAESMSKIRRKYAKQLSQEITEQLKDLNFLETNFDISLEQTASLTANGYDEACFLISMNPGSPMRPLGDVASGGELSRIMLAIKTVMADKDQTESLIFDEIDVGISGRTAQKVSEKMAVIAKSRQVICITHLPQIASMADQHYYIEKNSDGAKTQTTIRKLEREESIEELARILGGAQITEITLNSAKEMKEMAENTKLKRECLI